MKSTIVANPSKGVLKVEQKYIFRTLLSPILRFALITEVSRMFYLLNGVLSSAQDSLEIAQKLRFGVYEN